MLRSPDGINLLFSIGGNSRFGLIGTGAGGGYGSELCMSKSTD